jgi:hypothetical protein
LVIELLRLSVCAEDPFTDEEVVGLGVELPVLVEDIIEMRLSHEDVGRPLFARVSCAEASPAGFEGGFVYVCRRRRSLLLCDSTRFGLESAVPRSFVIRPCGERSNLL